MQRPRAAMIAIGLLMFAAPQTADADPFSDLATIVTSNYPLKNKVATGGPNWCFQIQAGNEFNPWSAAMKNPETKQLEWTPFDSYQSKKIMLVGTIPGTTKMGTFDDYHALLFGIDFLDNTPYSFKNIIGSLSTKAETGGESQVKSPQNVLLPEDNCPPLEVEITKFFANRAQSWAPVGNPLCMDPFYTQPDNNGTMTPCRKDQNSGLYEKRKSAYFGDTSYTLPKWNFDSHPAHPVVGVYRFLIMLCPAKVDDNGNLKPCDGASATANGYLNVGYTGSGGAG